MAIMFACLFISLIQIYEAEQREVSLCIFQKGENDFLKIVLATSGAYLCAVWSYTI